MVESPEISAVVPCLNEAENVVAIAKAITDELDRIATSHEIIFIDNGSTDGTVDLVKILCEGDARIRLIANNKNYGQMRSPTYGIYQARGRAIIGICADFQDPIDLLEEFVRRWRGGAKIVLGVRRSERTSLFLRSIRAVGYGFFSRFGDYKVIPGATGFGLYDRVVVDCLKQWRDPEPFFRGMLVESGFQLETVPYDRPPRLGGETKNNASTLLSFAISGLASSSKKLLRLPLYVAMIAFALAGIFFFVALCGLVSHYSVLGWLIASGVTCAFSCVFFSIGLLGEQIRLISEISRNVPLVIERERVNFPGS